MEYFMNLYITCTLRKKSSLNYMYRYQYCTKSVH